MLFGDLCAVVPLKMAERHSRRANRKAKVCVCRSRAFGTTSVTPELILLAAPD